MPKYTIHDIHIQPGKTKLMQFDEYYGGKKTATDYYIEPYGQWQHNEMCDTVYVDPDHVISYHEHTRGVETFLVDGGSVEVMIRGKKCLCTRGDIIHLAPFTPHKFRWVDAGTIWRELFQETQMVEDMLAHLRFKEYHPDSFDMGKDGQGTNSVWYTYDPVTVDVPKDQVPEVRPYEGGLSVFKFDGIELRQKVGRWETKGHKEIWQYCVEPGYELSWSEENPFYGLFIVQAGSVEVRIDGMEKFVAKERDILHIPNHLRGEIVALENTVLFDYNCEGYGLRAMEELNAMAVSCPERLADAAEEILRKNQCYLRGRKLK